MILRILLYYSMNTSIPTSEPGGGEVVSVASSGCMLLFVPLLCGYYIALLLYLLRIGRHVCSVS